MRREPESARGEAFAEAVLERLARAGRFRDEETAEHVERMSRSCALVARQLGWDARRCSELRAASAMHDIGKVGVPDSILRKPDKLAPEERPLVQAHATIGHEILSGSSDPVIELAATIALTHHERFDGSGYPSGLTGDAIPIAGRIAAVADVFDALTHDRVYRSAFSIHESLETLRRGRGTQFDPAVVDAFDAVLPEIEAVRALYPDGERSSGAQTLFVRPAPVTCALVVSELGAVGKGLELLLRRDGIDVAGVAPSVDAAVDALDRTAVDVVIVGDKFAGEEGLVRRAKQSGAAVLIYTSASRPGAAAHSRAIGADGVAAVEGSPAEFIDAVRAVARGERHSDPRVAHGAGALRGSAGRKAGGQGTLTAREREVVTLLATGLSGEEIAARLFLSSETVRTHVRNAMQRLGVRTRAHLVARAITSGEIPGSPPTAAA